MCCFVVEGREHLHAGKDSAGAQLGVQLLVVSSGHTTSDEANATSDDGSLQLPEQAPVLPGRAVQPDPGRNRQDQKDDQASAVQGVHLASASAFPVHPADPVGGNLLGADRLAFEVAAAAAEALGLHLALQGVCGRCLFR